MPHGTSETAARRHSQDTALCRAGSEKKPEAGKIDSQKLGDGQTTWGKGEAKKTSGDIYSKAFPL